MNHTLSVGWNRPTEAIGAWCSCGASIDFNDDDWTLPEAYEAHLRAAKKAEHEHL